MRIADADRDGKRFVVQADEKLTAFMEIEAETRRASRRTELSYETGLSNSICAAWQPSRANRNREEKLSSRHRGP